MKEPRENGPQEILAEYDPIEERIEEATEEKSVTEAAWLAFREEEAARNADDLDAAMEAARARIMGAAEADAALREAQEE